MAIQDLKITTYEDNIKNLSDYPSNDGVSATQLKALFDGRTDKEVKTSLNGLVDEVDNHVSNTENPHGVTKTQVGLGNADNTSDLIKPVSMLQAAAIAVVQSDINAHKNNTNNPHYVTGEQIPAGGGYGAMTVTQALSVTEQAAIGVESLVEAHKGDKDNPHNVTAAQLGLGNVDNTSDLNKPISTATQTALNLKAPIASPTFTGTVSGVTKAHVGLGNVDNTSDANKPISTATQAALDLKADSSDLTAHTTNTDNPHNVTATQLGLDVTKINVAYAHATNAIGGANLFDQERWNIIADEQEQNYIIPLANSDFEVGGTYTVSGDFSSVDDARILMLDEHGFTIGSIIDISSVQSFTIPEGTVRIGVSLFSESMSLTPDELIPIMINEGSTALPYEPYIAPAINPHNVSAAQIDIADTGEHFTAETVEDALAELATDKVDTSSIVNDLTTGGATNALSAEQGKVLDGYHTPIATYTVSGNRAVEIESIDEATGVFTATAHGFANGDKVSPIMNTIDETEFPLKYYPTGLTFKTYYIVGATTDTFQISETIGGTAVTFTVNADMDLTKWKMENPLFQLVISDLPVMSKCKLVLTGKNISSGLYVRPYGVNLSGAVPTFTSVWWQSDFTTAAIKPGTIPSACDITQRKDILIDYTGILTIQCKSVAVSSNTTSANKIETKDVTHISPKYSAGEFNAINLEVLGAFNGFKVEVYRA